ncbi:hypothetical protein [Caballeronia glebae]|uniref:hypothetical protein n=1 Tax=Caballeronia glebae TaxID=1777143 RepID=UPI0038BBE164
MDAPTEAVFEAAFEVVFEVVLRVCLELEVEFFFSIERSGTTRCRAFSLLDALTGMNGDADSTDGCGALRDAPSTILSAESILLRVISAFVGAGLTVPATATGSVPARGVEPCWSK